MKKVFSKLNAKRGASITIALLITMLCALAGASALIMASSSAGVYSHTPEDQQPYYSVTSAALLMVELLSGMTYTSSEVNLVYEYEWKNGDITKESYTLDTEIKGTITGTRRAMANASKFLAAIKEHCDSLVPYLNIPDEWFDRANNSNPDATIARPAAPQPLIRHMKFEANEPALSNIGVVDATFIMRDNYDIIISFTYMQGEQKLYSANIYWQAVVEEPITSKDPVTTLPDNETGITTIKQTKNVTVSWEQKNVTISRGEALEA